VKDCLLPEERALLTGMVSHFSQHPNRLNPWAVEEDLKFIYDGWQCVAELNATNNALVRSYTWGLDMSGTTTGAGGVGGLISMTVHQGPLAGTYFYCYDGNGNVAALVNAADGATAASYEYGPFGELIRANGPLAFINPFRFSTKYQDDETGFLYYGYRYYDPSTGRWLNRDPIGEETGGRNLYAMVHNDPVDLVDMLGLWETDAHHDIVMRWLADTKWDAYPWKCCKLPVRALLKDGSDAVDGVHRSWLAFASAQSTTKAHEHAMSQPGEGAAAAEAKYLAFISKEIGEANSLANKARNRHWYNFRTPSKCDLMEQAIFHLGMAYHAYSDSLSPAHEGFQPWYGPIDGVQNMGLLRYGAYLLRHKLQEGQGVYEGMADSVTGKVKGRFQSELDSMLKE